MRTPTHEPATSAVVMKDTIIDARGVVKTYATGATRVEALRGIDFAVRRGEMVGVMGPSGCGKTTLLNCLSGLDAVDAGTIRIAGANLAEMGDTARTAYRARRMGFIFQVYNLLPVLSAVENVELPLLVSGSSPRQARQQALAALATVGLTEWASHRPAELSGGQRQRVAIASALAVDPALLLADEPVSMLDVSVRAEVLNLLARLRRERGIGVLLVTHDLATAVAVADRIAVMYLGRIVESGAAQATLARPAHPYTRALVDAHPVADPVRRRRRELPRDEVPNAARLPSGCRFRPRCRWAVGRCEAVDPPLEPVGADRAVACLRVAAGETLD